MSDNPGEVCLLCGRTESQIPLATWRYQGRELRICPQCTPALIHECENVLLRWQASLKQSDTEIGDRDAAR